MLRSLGPYDIQIMGQLEDRIVLPISNLPQMEAVLITTFVLPNTSETSPDGRMWSSTPLAGYSRPRLMLKVIR